VLLSSALSQAKRRKTEERADGTPARAQPRQRCRPPNRHQQSLRGHRAPELFNHGACYKVFKRELIQSVTLEENRFGIEPEIVAKIARTGARIYEVAISYHGRTYEEGKKIGWRDGLSALRCILQYGLLR